MSDTKSAQEQTTTEVSMMKTSLRTHFARLLDDELDVDEVTNWFASLGMVTGKQDITENAAALTHYFDDLGFNTGEDFCKTFADAWQKKRTLKQRAKVNTWKAR